MSGLTQPTFVLGCRGREVTRGVDEPAVAPAPLLDGTAIVGDRARVGDESRLHGVAFGRVESERECLVAQSDQLVEQGVGLGLVGRDDVSDGRFQAFTEEAEGRVPHQLLELGDRECPLRNRRGGNLEDAQPCDDNLGVGAMKKAGATGVERGPAVGHREEQKPSGGPGEPDVGEPRPQHPVLEEHQVAMAHRGHAGQHGGKVIVPNRDKDRTRGLCQGVPAMVAVDELEGGPMKSSVEGEGPSDSARAEDEHATRLPRRDARRNAAGWGSNRERNDRATFDTMGLVRFRRRLARLVGAVVVAVTSGGGPVAFGCLIDDGEVPPGMLARVRDTVLGPQDLASVQAQLGAYAQQRFRGPEGERQLLAALIDAELMAQDLVRRGAGDDPRVEFALLEEIATVHASAELQRRVPREPIVADEAALRRAYAERAATFTRPERRSAVGLIYTTYDEAEAALEALRRGDWSLREREDVVATGLASRDDAKYPAFHPILFDPALSEGEWLPVPIMVAEGSLMAAKVRKIEGGKVRPFDDPEVQEAVVDAVRAPRVAEAREAWMEDLEQRYPVVGATR